MSKTYTKRYSSIDEIKAANRAAGHFYFEPDTMRFFAGRVREQAIIGGRFFIHSTKACFRDTTRVYHVGVVNDAGGIDNIGPANGWHTPAQARGYARALAKLPFVPMNDGLPIRTETRVEAWEVWNKANGGPLAATS